MEDLCDEKYQSVKKLGSGSFGTIYKVIDKETKKEYAAKVEYKDAENIQIKSERDVYRALSHTPIGYLKLYDYFSGPEYRCLILTLVGTNLESVLNTQKMHRFDVKTVLMLAIQLLERIETLHEACFLHRDIKPDNLAMGLDDNSSTLYMLDLGLGKRFKYDNRHISYRTDKHLTGTARYASLHSHAGEELSRRDDLESIAYTLIYMSKGKLPWQGLRSDLYGSKYDKIYAMKKKISPAQLCKNLEPEFIEFLEYARNLLFTEKPDYERCRQMFRNVMIRKKLEMDYIYCWTKPTDKAAVKKRKKEEAEKQKKVREKEIRTKKAAQERKKINKQHYTKPYTPNFNDSLFSYYMPLEERRAIITENMKAGPIPVPPQPCPTMYPFALPFPIFETAFYHQPPPNHNYNTSSFLF